MTSSSEISLSEQTDEHLTTPIVKLIGTSVTRYEPELAACCRILSNRTFLGNFEIVSQAVLEHYELGGSAVESNNLGSLSIELDSGVIELIVDFSCFPILERLCAFQDNLEKNDELIELVTRHYLERIAQKIRALGFAVERVRIKRCQAVPAVLATLWIRLLADEAAFQVWLTRYENVVFSGERHDEMAFEISYFEALHGLRVPGALALGQIRLPVHRLSELKVGDVVLGAISPDVSDAFRDQAAANLGIRLGYSETRHLSGVASFRDNSLIIEEMKMSESEDSFEFEDSWQPSAADEDPDGADESTSMVELAELELPVKIEVATVPIPLDQLSLIKPGYVIALANRVEHAKVRLSVGGQTIGQGELVAVGEHLGVRIIQMVPTK